MLFRWLQVGYCWFLAYLTSPDAFILTLACAATVFAVIAQAIDARG